MPLHNASHIKLVGQPPILLSEALTRYPVRAEDIIHGLCRERLLVSPLVVPLFGLRDAKGRWLSPDQHLDQDDLALPLELRLRFKVPMPSKLKDLDQRAFLYAFEQVRAEVQAFNVYKDIKDSVVLTHREARGNRPSSAPANRSKWWSFLLVGGNDNSKNFDEDTKQRLDSFGIHIRLVCMILVVDMLDKDLGIKDVLKNSAVYFPKEIWANQIEKVTGLPKVKDTMETVLRQELNRKLTSNDHKLAFLKYFEEAVPLYFHEKFCAEFDPDNSGENSQAVTLIITPPFHGYTPPFLEKDPELQMEQLVSSHSGKIIGNVQTLCSVEDICYITASDDCLQLEISRKNGIPCYLKMGNRFDALSFLSHLSGYYRLCEKWTFSLCNAVTYPSLNFNLNNNIHGPIRNEDVESKFLHKVKYKAGSYILRQSQRHFNLYYIHVIMPDGKRPSWQITRSKEDHYTLVLDDGPQVFVSWKDMIRFLRSPDSPLPLRDCIHPSEYDKFVTLLLSRSISKLRSDLVGMDASASEAERKVVIPFNQLSKVENQKWMDGEFVAVWEGMWQVSKKQKNTVCIKQLLPKYACSQMANFVYMTHNMLTWNDATLVKAFGTTLATPHNPMALILEFFPLGPLSEYLKRNHDMQDLDLVEASASLARAVWYLEENELVHGFIHCGNVYVAEHQSNVFRVKLGDPGIFTEYGIEHVHWLPIEMLVVDRPSRQHCNSKSDVWALATTYWQIFSKGQSPMQELDPEEARREYLLGNRLPRPGKLKFSLGPIYEIMRECWNPRVDMRKEPQAIMRDMNHILYKVFNSKRVNAYMTIDDGDNSSNSNTITIENNSGTLTNQTTGGQSSTETVITQMENSGLSTPTVMSASRDGTISPNYGPPAFQTLVPTFNDMMRQFFEQPNPTADFRDLMNVLGGQFQRAESYDPLLSSWSSRPGSSQDGGSPSHLNGSQFTSQTSLGSFSTLYSMSSIYQLTSESQLEYSTDYPLGEGNFGVVYKGVMNRSNGEWDEVAIKKLKDKDSDCYSLEAQDEMRRELDIMKNLNHENVVKIKGIFADENKVLIIMEYLKEGSLDRYLYVHKESILSRCPKQLFLFAHNIVDGMEYLAQKGIIHRDLAARNILVANDELVKISDFGLARSVEADHYVMSSNTNIPVKWLALECLTHNRYSFASDVWSFGIILWEMFSLGLTPYLTGCENFFRADAPVEKHRDDMKQWLKLLEEGVRLPKPHLCPSALYTEVMLTCWKKDPHQRPDFTEMRKMLTKVELQVT